MEPVPGFRRIREQQLAALDARASLLHHPASGADVLSLELADPTKCFGIAFRTPPEDATGAAHVLEHMVFAGSEKYPLNDPLAAMLQRSLKLTLNGITYADRTCYLAASQHPRDFYHLVDFCLDAVFRPLLRPEAFQQHGWHYALHDPAQPLSCQGVVLNEMKGQYSAPEYCLQQLTQQALFPDAVYRFDAGGDPAAIPRLSYEQVRALHRRCYQPANALIFFAGDDDPRERLRLLQPYLTAAAPWVPPAIAPQPRFQQPRRIVRRDAGPAGGATPAQLVNLAWMLDDDLDLPSMLALRVLAQLLTAPLLRRLSEARLGRQLLRGGFHDMLRHTTFTIGIRGARADQVAEVEQLVLETLALLARDGIAGAAVAAAINTLEFRLREQNTGTTPRGLAWFARALTSWTYGGDPCRPLALDAPLAALKARLRAGEPVFEQLIERCLLGNPHRVTVALESAADGASAAEQERERLARIKARLKPVELAALVAQTRALTRYAAQPDPPAAHAQLPTLSRADLRRHALDIPCEHTFHGDTPVLYHPLSTNGIAYLDLGFDLRRLPAELLGYVPLFRRALLELGSAQTPAPRLAQRIGQTTGGLRTQFFAASADRGARDAAWLLLRGKATADQLPALLAIVRELLLAAALDQPTALRRLIAQEQTARERELRTAAHQLVHIRLRGAASAASWAYEQLCGVSQLWFLRDLARRIEDDWPAVHEALEQIRAALIDRSGMVCSITADAAGWREHTARLAEMLDQLPAGPAASAPWPVPPALPAEGLTLPSPVNFVGMGLKVDHHGQRQRGAGIVAGHYLDTTWVWNSIRAQGGAYGAYVTFDPRSGMLCWMSHHDPQLEATLAVFERSAAFLRAATLSAEELAAIMVGAIGATETAHQPDQQALVSLQRRLSGETAALRQQLRDEILATTPADLRAFAEVLEQRAEHSRIVAVGARPVLEAAVTRHGPLRIHELL